MNGLINRKEFLEKSGRYLSLALPGSLGLSYVEALARSGNEDYIKPALLWKKLPANAVRCQLCPNECVLNKGERGICRVRKNINGSLYTLVYSRVVAAHIDPVEKKPMYHFLPGSAAFSIATAGCNLSCKFCQNWEISQADPENTDAVKITPAELSVRAKSAGTKVIAYTYNEPTVQFEYIIDSSARAKEKGLRPVIISSGYIKPQAGKILARNLDAVKIDLKSFTENFYSSICGGSLKPVLDNLVSIHGLGKWLELVVLIIPTLNDSPTEIKEMCTWVKKNLSANVPMHFTRFRSMYKIQNLPPTPVSTLEQCYKIAKEAGIRYPYVGNVPGHNWGNTYCHNCGRMLIRRSGFYHIENNISNGQCPYCRTRIPGVWS